MPSRYQPAAGATLPVHALHAYEDCPSRRMSVPSLSALEVRVLGVLVEKQRTVPDTYPLTLNALLSGCNQKTSRDPVISVGESEVLATLDRLKADSWIVETSGGRVMRYAHNVERVLGIPAQSAALLATLMLRGPQTSAELRANAERLHRFADISAAEAFLNELAERPAGALVAELPRAPGTRETRWAHRLAGHEMPGDAIVVRGVIGDGFAGDDAQPPDQFSAATGAPASASHELESLRGELARLRVDLDRLGATVAELAARLPAELPTPR